MTTKKKLTSGAILVIYALIMLEGILMATPFAVYLYSFYFPFLEGVQQSILTAWISSFFFRHVVVETNSTFLEIIGWMRFLFPIGIIGFFVFALIGQHDGFLQVRKRIVALELERLVEPLQRFLAATRRRQHLAVLDVIVDVPRRQRDRPRQ